MNVLMPIHPNPNGTQYHRMVAPRVMLQNNGYKVKKVDDLSKCTLDTLKWADVVIVSRLISEFPHQQPKVLKYLKAEKTPLIVDLDDHWTLPEGHPEYLLWKQNRTESCIRETLKHATAVWTTNEYLRKQITRKTTAPVTIIPNGISKYDEQWEPSREKLPTENIMIGVSCFANHYPDIERLRPALDQIRTRMGWHIFAMGVPEHAEQDIKTRLGTNRITFARTRKAHEYADLYRSIDLLVCPLDRKRFNRSRSDLKLAEAAHSYTPVMVEDYGPYAGSPYSVSTWNTLPEVIINALETGRQVFEEWRISDVDAYTTDEADAKRLQSLQSILEPATA